METIKFSKGKTMHAFNTSELKELLKEKHFLQHKEEIIHALNLIACWEEESEDYSRFDEPHSARIARELLAKLGITKGSDNV